MAGGDPRVTPATEKRESETLTVAEFLDRYFTNYVEAEGLQDPVTIKGRLKAIKAVIGNEPVRALEKAEPDSAVQGGVPRRARRRHGEQGARRRCARRSTGADSRTRRC